MQRGETPRYWFIYHLSYVHGLVLAGPWASSKPRSLVSSFNNSSRRLLLALWARQRRMRVDPRFSFWRGTTILGHTSPVHHQAASPALQDLVSRLEIRFLQTNLYL